MVPCAHFASVQQTNIDSRHPDVSVFTLIPNHLIGGNGATDCVVLRSGGRVPAVVRNRDRVAGVDRHPVVSLIVVANAGNGIGTARGWPFDKVVIVLTGTEVPSERQKG